MHRVSLILLATILAVVLAEGQYYVPRAYYTIDAEGHASAPVPLRRLRRSLSPYPYNRGVNANANANASANAEGVDGANANANAQAHANARGSGNWGLPAPSGYGASYPKALGSGQFSRQAGPVMGGRTVSASTSVGLDSSGKGYYDQYASVDE